MQASNLGEPIESGLYADLSIDGSSALREALVQRAEYEYSLSLPIFCRSPICCFYAAFY